MSRRAFVLGTTASVAMSAAGAKTHAARASAARASADGGSAVAATTGAGDLCNLGATEAVAQMSQGALTAERYAQALLARCRSAHALNAFITLEPERVLEDARTRDVH